MGKTINISPESINAKELQLKPEDDLEAFVADWALSIHAEDSEEENIGDNLSNKDLVRIHTQDPYEFFG